MYVRFHLSDEDRRLYDRVADLLGPAGSTALESLAEAIFAAGEEYAAGYASDDGTAVYLEAVKRADVAKIARWRSRRCPECSMIVHGEGTVTDDNGRVHVVVNQAVAIGCQGYHVISPAAVGLSGAGWNDWADNAGEEHRPPAG